MKPPEERVPLVPLDRIAYLRDDGSGALTSEGPDILRSAGVIMGHDLLTGDETVFYGRDVLERVVQAGQPEGVMVLRVALNFEIGELELLIAAITEVRGRCDYQDPPDPEGERT
jgi:hypothetical protein